jgi:hypothetical protein
MRSADAAEEPAALQNPLRCVGGRPWVHSGVATFRRRITLLDGRLTLLFLGSPMADLVPLLFGERFWAVVYDVWPLIRARRKCATPCVAISTHGP